MNKLNRMLAVLTSAALLGLAGCATPTGNAFIDDSNITMRVKNAIFNDKALHVTDVSVSTEKGVVTLSGSVKTPRERTKAADVARAVDGVRRVNNNLRVGK